MKEVYFEHITWRKDDVLDSSLKVVGLLHTGLRGVRGLDEPWGRFTVGIIRSVERFSREPVGFSGFGFEIDYFPPNRKLVPIIEDESIVVTQKPPKLVFYDHSFGELLPSQRSLMFDGVEAALEEAAETYKLEGQGTTCTFPIEHYGSSSRVLVPDIKNGQDLQELLKY